jgi:hypothetical protein
MGDEKRESKEMAGEGGIVLSYSPAFYRNSIKLRT